MKGIIIESLKNFLISIDFSTFSIVRTNFNFNFPIRYKIKGGVNALCNFSLIGDAQKGAKFNDI